MKTMLKVCFAAAPVGRSVVALAAFVRHELKKTAKIVPLSVAQVD